jgi:D-aspartate ligase
MTILLIELIGFTILGPKDRERLMMNEFSKNVIGERMPIAFVLHMGPNGLGVTRSLAREGVQVVGVDYDAKAPGFFSRYCRPLLCPDPRVDPEGTIELLRKEGEKLPEKGVLYACSDMFVLFVSRNRSALSEHFKFMISPEEVLEGMINKRRLYDEAERIGTRYSRTFYPKDWSDLEEIKDRIIFPAFIKPYYSHLWSSRFNNKGFVVKNYQEVVERYKLVFPSGLDTMIQTIVQGPESNIVTVSTYIGRKGEPFGAFVWQKIRQCPKDFGVGSLTKSVHDDDLSSEAIKFFREIGYRGIGSLEFKRDERDGEFRLIELNARTWLQNVQATYSGINFPMIQYLDLLERPIGPIRDYKDGVRWFDSIGDLESYWAYRKSGSLSFGDWVRSWLGSECHARFAWDDIRPSLVAAEYGLTYIKLLNRLSKAEKKDRNRT